MQTPGQRKAEPAEGVPDLIAELVQQLAAESRGHAVKASSLGAKIVEQTQTTELLRNELEAVRAELGASRAESTHLAGSLRDVIDSFALASESNLAPPPRAHLPDFDASALCANLRADIEAELATAHERDLAKLRTHLDGARGEVRTLQDVIKVLQSDVAAHVAAKKELRAKLTHAEVQIASLTALVPLCAQRHFSAAAVELRD
ncbi:hypothetical protein KFE25_013124 [Diacronema lutheri]|uniref:Uncharacterized protein n=2 Tax=Diacronema lutheri TaxID=2081491 RepID=A0A8J5XGP1_DIALT|nr:hypothetical protein KFE25_013124 [Diacronema lutheri]